ncbi:MAG TPA: glutamine synthetase family protein [Caldimonas sp.]|jgi:glutamine synthetase|nr:glutamine synthetase family protein [Caldimonas sp.]
MVQTTEPTDFADLERWLDERRVTEVECLVPDLAGIARGKILPRNRFTAERGLRLPEGTVALSVGGEVPRRGPFLKVVHPTDPDIDLRPDPATVRIVPWASDPTAQVIHDCYDRTGQLVPYAARSVLRRVCRYYDEAGWSPVVAPELEFYLVARSSDADLPLRLPIGRSGRSESTRQSYSIDAVNEFDPLFEDVYQYCKQMELNVDTLIHETGAGQMEINFFHSHPLSLADQVFFFKRTLREAALRHDMHATFMAKPIAGEPGSAMHVHQSIVDKASGRNLFSKADGTPSEEFHWYIGGLQRYIPAAMALFAPYVNSYRRLARYTAAPINTHWGSDNRTVGIRAPIAPPSARRIENRVIGADSNPYIAIAATLACGYLGMRNRIEPSAACTDDAYQQGYMLSRSLGEALQLLRDDEALREILGDEFVTVYTEVKEVEHDEFMKVISPWEREHLLLHV